MQIHANPWKSTKIHGNPWKSIKIQKIQEHLRKSIENDDWRVENASKWKSAPYGPQNCSEKFENHDEIKNLEN